MSDESPAANETSLLMSAARDGDLEILQELVSIGKDLNERDAEGVTPLMWAAHASHIEAIKTLLHGGADPDLADPSGCTALMWAARAGKAEAVKLFLAEGTKWETQTPAGQTAADIALEKGQLTAYQILRQWALQRRDGAAPQAAAKPMPKYLGVRTSRGPAWLKEDLTRRIVAAVLLLAISGMAVLIGLSLSGRGPFRPKMTYAPRAMQANLKGWLAFAVDRIEAYRAKRGHLPEDLNEIDLEGGGYEYSRDGERYRITVRRQGDSLSYESPSGQVNAVAGVPDKVQGGSTP